MRAVSASLSATDRTHHFDFVNSAENYRRRFVKDLNLAEMNKQKLGSSPEDRRVFWEQVTEFQPNFVPAMQDVKRSLVGLLCIIAWAILMGIASLFAPPKISRT